MKLIFAIAALSLAAAPAIAAETPKPASTDWRAVDADNTMVIDTNRGRVIVELYPEVAPLSVARVAALTRRGFYDGLTFFRVVDDFMAQTGDPRNNGEGGSDQPDVKAEFTFKVSSGGRLVVVANSPGADAGFVGALPVLTQPAAMAALNADGKVNGFGMFCPGVVGMARSDDPDSANSQFFLMRRDHPSLNQKYTAFGRVVVGEDVVRKLKAGDPEYVSDPKDRMVKVQMLADMPEKDRPTVQVIDTKSAYFAAKVSRTMTAKGAKFTPCNLEVEGTAK